MLTSSAPAPLYAPIVQPIRPRPNVEETWKLPSQRIVEVRRVVGSLHPRIVARYVENGVLTTKEVDLPLTLFMAPGAARVTQ